MMTINEYIAKMKRADKIDEFDYLSNCTDIEDVQILQKYIALVRKNVDSYNPLNHILLEMRATVLDEDL